MPIRCPILRKAYRQRPDQKAKADEYQKRTREKRLDEPKAGKSCELCGEDFPDCLDFHHRDPSQKIDTISRVARYRPKPELLAEVAKCILLCSNCHRKLHAMEREGINVAP